MAIPSRLLPLYTFLFYTDFILPCTARDCAGCAGGGRGERGGTGKGAASTRAEGGQCMEDFAVGGVQVGGREHVILGRHPPPSHSTIAGFIPINIPLFGWYLRKIGSIAIVRETTTKENWICKMQEEFKHN